MRRDGWSLGLEVLAASVGAVLALAIWWAVLRAIDAVAGWRAP